MDGNLAMNSHFENMSEADNNATYEAAFIKKGNKAIAIFMGMLKKEGEHLHLWVKKVEDFIGENCPADIDILCLKLQYHSLWERLMPVVNKIESLGWSVVIVKGMCHIFSDDLIDNSKEFANKSNNDLIEKICLVWKTVFEFVDDYNSEILNVQPPNDMQCGVGKNNI